MTNIEFFEELIKLYSYKCDFEKYEEKPYNDYIFDCEAIDCEKCKLKKECDKKFLYGVPHFKRDSAIHSYLKSNYPEYFI